MSIRVMDWVWHNSPATGTDRLVLLAIADNADDTGHNAWPSIATIAQKANASESTVHRSIAHLVHAGLLLVERQRGGTSDMRNDRRPNRYTVVIHRQADPRGVTDCTPWAYGVSSETPRGVTGDTQTVLKPSSTKDLLDTYEGPRPLPDALKSWLRGQLPTNRGSHA